MWLCLLHPEIRELYVDRERVVREGIAHLRAAWAAHPEDQALTDLIAEFTAHDEAFARLWAERDVKVERPRAQGDAASRGRRDRRRTSKC